jgi:hypothetical protein
MEGKNGVRGRLKFAKKPAAIESIGCGDLSAPNSQNKA